MSTMGGMPNAGGMGGAGGLPPGMGPAARPAGMGPSPMGMAGLGPMMGGAGRPQPQMMGRGSGMGATPMQNPMMGNPQALPRGGQINPNFRAETGVPGINNAPRQNAPAMSNALSQFFSRFRGY